MATKFQTEDLVKIGYDFSKVFPEKQKYMGENMQYEFSLPEVVQLLREQSNDFIYENPVLLDLDAKIFDLCQQYQVSIGQPMEVVIKTGKGTKPEVAVLPPKPKEEPISEPAPSPVETVVVPEDVVTTEAPKASKREILVNKINGFKVMEKMAKGDKKKMLADKIKGFELMLKMLKPESKAVGGAVLERTDLSSTNIISNKETGIVKAVKDPETGELLKEVHVTGQGLYFYQDGVYVSTEDKSKLKLKDTFKIDYKMSFTAGGNLVLDDITHLIQPNTNIVLNKETGEVKAVKDPETGKLLKEVHVTGRGLFFYKNGVYVSTEDKDTLKSKDAEKIDYKMSFTKGGMAVLNKKYIFKSLEQYWKHRSETEFGYMVDSITKDMEYQNKPEKAKALREHLEIIASMIDDDEIKRKDLNKVASEINSESYLKA